MYLKPHSTLQDSKYQVVRVLGQGGFGITYEAIQVGLRRKVAIKEFFMKGYCNRDSDTSAVTHGMTDDSRGLVERYMSKFVREAQMIAGMDHPNIVRIYDVFEENGTAYYVMEYLEGGSLESIVVEKGRLPVKEACGYIRQVGAALKYIHSHQSLHFDVKPSNVLLNKDGRAVLIDFGVSKHYDEAGNQTSSTPVGISKGYAPLEQYQAAEISTFTPATDIYALGATLYRLVTGNVPPSASEVNEDGLPEMNGVPGNVAKAIKAAMQPRRQDRPQSVEEFLALLDSSAPETTKAAEDTVIINTSPAKKKGVPSWIYAVISAVVIAVGVFLLWPKGGGSDIGAASQPDSTAVAQVATKEPVASSETPVKQEPSVVAVKEVKISKSKLELQEGETASLSATVNPYDATEKAVTWKSTNESVAKVSNGRVTAVKAGSAAVIASSGGKEAYCNVTVSAKPSPVQAEPSVVAVKEVKISKSKLELQEGETASLSATVNPSDATEKAVTWKSTNESVAKVSNGRVTAVRAGSAAVIASAGGKEAYCNVTVLAKPSPVQTESRGTGTISGHEWVDLGLSVKWATCNVGAASPGDYGNYYAWGETSTKSDYTWETYRFRTSGDSYDNVSFSKYNTLSGRGTVDNKSRLDKSDDVARQNWGGSWRMPTDGEWTELRTKCTWSWTTQNGHNGYKVTSKSNGSSIFLPAAGYAGYRDGGSLINAGSYGYYWSSSLFTDSYYAWIVYFDSGDVDRGYGSRYLGDSVRPVTE